ncbi:hypothetical protein [Longimycelium tulufanense]|nr:hypothetical protein [Longimycelium tulufanense]
MRRMAPDHGQAEAARVFASHVAVWDQQREALRAVARVCRRQARALWGMPGVDPRAAALAAQLAWEADAWAQRTYEVEAALQQGEGTRG